MAEKTRQRAETNSVPPGLRPSIPAYRIIYNWDGNPVGYTEYPQSIEDLLAKIYAPIADTQVDALFWSVGEHEAAWPSETMPVVGDSVGRVYETVWGMRRAESIRAMFERGENPYAEMVGRGRELDVAVWASIRINDNHLWSVSPDGEVKHADRPDWWMTSTHRPLQPGDLPKTVASGLTPERRDHPEWLLGHGAPPWVSTSWNLAIPEARELRLQHISEAVRLADWDGLELDWQRHGYHLPENDTHRLRYTLTDLQRAVRRLTDEIAGKRGRPFYLAVRVAATLEACRRIGYDIQTWAREGLCDIVIPSGNSGTDSGVEVEAFQKVLNGTHIKLHPGLDTDFRLHARRLMPHLTWRDAWIRATANELWARGADGLYVFNWHANARTRRGLLTTIGSPGTLERTDKVYAAIHGINVAKGTLRYGVDRHDRLYAESPVTLYRTLAGDGPTFHIPFHDDTIAASQAGLLERIELQIELEHYSPADRVRVTLDGQELGAPTVRCAAAEDPDDPSDVDENGWLTWSLEPKMMAAGVHEVRVTLIERDPRIRSPLVVQHVEIHVSYT